MKDKQKHNKIQFIFYMKHFNVWNAIYLLFLKRTAEKIYFIHFYIIF